MNKKLKLCPAPRCKQKIDGWRFCCKWHWGQLTDYHRVGIIKLTGPEQAKKKHEAITFLQGVQHEKDKQKLEQNETAGCGDC